jgi:hypothetical protein
MAESNQGGHERSDVHIRPIVLFGAGLAVALVLVLAVTYVMMQFFLGRADEADRARPDVALRQAPAAGGLLPSGPPLQVDPIAEMRGLRAREEAVLTSYGWVDREAGVVRVPIDRAMEMLLRGGGGRPAEARP